jgi:photosystem II stability/assembly factor-like uncharacterized protein
MIAGEPSTGIFSIAFRGRNGIAVGGDYKKESEGSDNVMRSKDNGRSWQLVTGPKGGAPFPFRSAIGYLNANALVAVGPSGTNLSRDGGATWKSLPGDAGFHTLSIADQTVWAAGAKGRVGRLQPSTRE